MENSERDGNTRPPDLPLGKLYAVQEATVRTGHGTTDSFQIGKEVNQGCILSPCLYHFYAEPIMRKAGLDEAQTGMKTVITFSPSHKSFPAARSILMRQLFAPGSQSIGASVSASVLPINNQG